MTPKSLLRRKESTSALADLADPKGFHCVIGDPAAPSPKKVKRVVFCSGKVFFDIAAERDKRGIDNVALVRLEQLYPFPHSDFAEQIARYPNAKSVVWAQEEPANQGAWHRIQHYLLEHVTGDRVLTAAQRKSSASPAVGYLALHNQQQKEIIDAALTLDAASSKKAAA